MSNKAETMKKIYIVLAIVSFIYLILTIPNSIETIAYLFDFDISYSTLLIILSNALSYVTAIASSCFILLRFTVFRNRDNRHKFFSFLFIITGSIGIISSIINLLECIPYVDGLIESITYFGFEFTNLSPTIMLVSGIILSIATHILAFFVADEIRKQKEVKIFSKVFLLISVIIPILNTSRNYFNYPMSVFEPYTIVTLLFSFLGIALVAVAIFDIDNKATMQAEEIQVDTTETQTQTDVPQTDANET